MINKNLLIEKLEKLTFLAKSRNTKQGIIVYEAVILKLRDSNSNQETLNILGEINNALNGIEAHGFWTDEEFNIVNDIRKM